MLKLKSWHISSIKAISTCASSGKRMRFWTFTDAFVNFKRFRRVVTFYNGVERCGSVSVLSADIF